MKHIWKEWYPVIIGYAVILFTIVLMAVGKLLKSW
jgi:hypothetical protein